MAQVTALVQTATPGRTRSFTAKTEAAVLTYGSPIGMAFLFQSSLYPAHTPKFEALLKATTGTVYARLRNITDDTVVTDSAVSTAGTSDTRVRSSSLTLTDQKAYRMEVGKVNPDAGTCSGGHIVFEAN